MDTPELVHVMGKFASSEPTDSTRKCFEQTTMQLQGFEALNKSTRDFDLLFLPLYIF